jgi:hypothetical protein
MRRVGERERARFEPVTDDGADWRAVAEGCGTATDGRRERERVGLRGPGDCESDSEDEPDDREVEPDRVSDGPEVWC